MNIAASTQLTVEPKMERFKKEPRIKPAKKVEAGGPGSGRHKGFGSSEQAAMHHTLTVGYGMKHIGPGKSGDGSNTHVYRDKKNGHAIITTPKGYHAFNGMDSRPEPKMYSGKTNTALQSHLNGFTKFS